MARLFFLLFFSILLSTSVSRTVVESSSTPPLLIKLVESSSSIVESKITIGSSISAGAGASFWISSSGIFSFGFYPLNSYNQDYIIGIWINNNPTLKTLVWWINQDDPPLSNATSLLLNHDGKFVIRFSNGTKEKPLFHQADSLLSSSISYASILDNGNLVFYNSNSTIIWESFDYPTHTILSGQTLHSKQSIVSNGYCLLMQDNGNLMLYTIRHYHECTAIDVPVEEEYKRIYIVWQTRTQMKNGSPVELKLDSTGHLYLEDWNGLIRKSLNNGSIYKGGEEQQQEDKVIYRATLGRDGVFRLYKEKIDEEKEIHTVVVWDTKEKTGKVAEIAFYVFSAVFITVSVGLPAYLVYTCIDEYRSSKQRELLWSASTLLEMIKSFCKNPCKIHGHTYSLMAEFWAI